MNLFAPFSLVASARPGRGAIAALFLLAVTGSLTGCGSGAPEPIAERIIVSGASGQLGGMVVDELLARGVAPENLILVSRTPETLANYAAMGAITRFGDFTQPESLDSAYAGGTRMLLISINTFGERPTLHGNAIDAAVRAGVRHIAYTSFVDAENNPSPIAADHRATEALLRESGIAWTMLRNQLYMDGVVGQASRMLGSGRVEVASDETRTAYVTRADCAAAAAAVLATPGHENRIYEITGPAAIGAREIAAAATEVTGIPIEVVAAEPAADGPGASAPTSASIVSTAVADLTGRAPGTVVDLLRENREALVAAVERP